MSVLRELMLKILLKKEVDVMAVVYATLIIKGRKTIDQVPAIIRDEVKQILKDLEVEGCGGSRAPFYLKGRDRMALNVYSLERDGEKSLSKNFKVKEFRCKDGSDPIFIDSELVEILQKVRDHFGKPVIINSAYRTAAYNLSKKVGGAKFSQHQYGKAADIYIQGILITKLAEYVETLMPNKGGIGIYPIKTGVRNCAFVHVDVRAAKGRWKG